MSAVINEEFQSLLSDAVRAMRAGDHKEALRLTGQIIRRDPNHAGAYAIQFSSLFKAKKFEHARQIGGMAARLNPKSVFILNNQACLQLEAKQPAAASGLLKSLIDQFGEQGQWLYNLALSQRMVGNYDYSIETFRRTLDHQPDHDRGAFQLADCLSVIGHKEEAIRAYDYVRLLRNRHAPSHSNYIHHAVANDSLTSTGLQQELRLWEERFVPHGKTYQNDEISDFEKLKIGFLVGNLPTNWLEETVAPVINELADGNDDVFVYWHDEKLRNDVFNQSVTVINSPGLTDADFARQVRSDGIQILVDICGMRRGTRQRTLGLQVASRQYGWLAHEGKYATSRVSLLDPLLGTERFFVSGEKSAFETPTAPLPPQTLAGIGCRYGLSYNVLKVWAEILRELPHWNLHLDSSSALVNRLLVQRFSSLGVDEARLVFNEQFAVGENTIVLDNFVENDPVAASNAMAAGGILVALKGDLFPAQQSAALLTQVGKPQWLCKNPRAYFERVLDLADNRDEEPVTTAEFFNADIRNLTGFTQRFRRALTS